MITRPLFVNEALTSNHDSACYVDPRDGNVCSRGHKARKDVLKYIADLEATVDDANVVKQFLVDAMSNENGMTYVTVGDRVLYATGHGPEETDGKTEDAGGFEGGEITTVDLERVSSTIRPDSTVEPAKGW